MSLSTLHIDTDPDHFKVLYSKVLFTYLYKNPEYKDAVLITAYFLSLIIIAYLYHNSEEFHNTLRLIAIFFVLSPVIIYMKINDKLEWNQLIYEFQKDLMRYTNFTLKYNRDVLVILKDHKEYIYQWTLLENFYVEEQYIIIEIGERIIIPKTATQENEFIALSDFLSE